MDETTGRDTLNLLLDRRLSILRKKWRAVHQQDRYEIFRYLGRSVSAIQDSSGVFVPELEEGVWHDIVPHNITYPLTQHVYAFLTSQLPSPIFKGYSPSDNLWAPIVAADFNVRWQDAHADEAWMEWVLQATVCGQAWVYVGRDEWEDPHQPTVRVCSPCSVFLDPAVKGRNLCQSRYLVELQRLPVDLAVSYWPKQAEALKQAARSGDKLDGNTENDISIGLQIQDLGGGQFGVPPYDDADIPSIASEEDDERYVLLERWYIIDGATDPIPFSDEEVQNEHAELLASRSISPALPSQNHPRHIAEHEELAARLDPNNSLLQLLRSHIQHHQQFPQETERPRYPNGRRIVRVGHTILEDEPNPYPFLPYELLRVAPVPDTSVGQGIPAIVEPMQRQITVATDARMRYANGFLRPGGILHFNERTHLEGQNPNFYQQFVYLRRPELFQRFEPPKMDAEYSAYIEEARNWAQFVTGIFDPALGKPAGEGARGGVAINLLQDATRERTDPIGKELRAATACLMNKFLWCIYAFGRPGWVSVEEVSPELAQAVQQLGLQNTPADPSGLYIYVNYPQEKPRLRVRVEEGYRVPPQKLMQQTVVAEMLKSQTIPPGPVLQEMVIDAMDVPNAPLLKKKLAAQQEAAQQAQEQQLQMELQFRMKELELEERRVAIEEARLLLDKKIAEERNLTKLASGALDTLSGKGGQPANPGSVSRKKRGR